MLRGRLSTLRTAVFSLRWDECVVFAHYTQSLLKSWFFAAGCVKSGLIWQDPDCVRVQIWFLWFRKHQVKKTYFITSGVELGMNWLNDFSRNRPMCHSNGLVGFMFWSSALPERWEGWFSSVHPIAMCKNRCWGCKANAPSTTEQRESFHFWMPAKQSDWAFLHQDISSPGLPYFITNEGSDCSIGVAVSILPLHAPLTSNELSETKLILSVLLENFSLCVLCHGLLPIFFTCCSGTKSLRWLTPFQA